MSRWPLLAAVGALVLPATAQEGMLAHSRDGIATCTVRTLACAGSVRPGGFGFVRIEIENVDTREHAVLVEVVSPRFVTADVRVHRSLVLPPKERAVSFFPVPTPFPTASLRFLVDGIEQATSLNLAHGEGMAGLLVSDRPDAGASGVAWLHRLAATGGTGQPHQSLVAAASAPSDWRLYTGFDVVLVDGRAAVSVDVQEALRRAAFAGATVLLADPDSLPAGPLRTVSPGGSTAYGLGVLHTIESLEASPALSASMRSFGDGPLPIEDGLLLEAPIPGLGEAPVRVFLTVIVVFALVAGPVNFLWLRRRKQPLLALVTVPALGLGTTVAILAFGYFHDGFGVRGVAVSWTLLDQERHEAVTVCSRSLFAGSAPGAIALPADSMLVAPRATGRQQGAADRFHFDVGAAALDGGVLPSRTSTPLVTVQQGVVRQRLVARRDGDRLRLLADGGVVPLDKVVLRDRDGDYWFGPAGDLERIEVGPAEQRLDEARSNFASTLRLVPGERRWGRGRFREQEVETMPKTIGTLDARFLPGSGLDKGSYLALVAHPAWLDEHGFAARYDIEMHWVRGRLGAEDFVR
jgi:hypothetical protein